MKAPVAWILLVPYTITGLLENELNAWLSQTTRTEILGYCTDASKIMSYLVAFTALFSLFRGLLQNVGVM